MEEADTRSADRIDLSLSIQSGSGFMTKSSLRSMTYDLTAWKETIHWFGSSGTTGEPTIYPWTTVDEECALHVLERIHGANEAAPPGSTAFIVAPTGLPSMWAHMDRQLRFLKYATVFPGVDSPKRIIQLLSFLRPRLLMSLPIVLTRLGELWQFAAKDRQWHPDILFTGGDVLSNARRQRLRILWQCDVRNYYGLSEIFGPLASEITEENIFDWLGHEVHVEILDTLTREPVSVGQTGVAVYTTLWNRPAKLVRYWSGDLFRLVQWLAPGRPRFEIRGREYATLPGLRPDAHPVDVDDILLADPAVGNEWTIESREYVLVIVYESNQPPSAMDAETMRRLQDCFFMPIQCQTAMPGSLDRSHTKLGLAVPGHRLE